MNNRFQALILRHLFLFAVIFLSSQLTACFDKNGNNGEVAHKPLPSTRLLKTLDKPFPAPDTVLMDMDDKPHKLSDYRGKPVIVNFWATWCPPCRAELPSMNRAWAKLKDDGVQMLAVNMAESEDTIFPFTGDYPIDFPILLDSNGEYAINWHVKGLPTTYIVDPDGQVVYQAVGGREWDNEEILDVVRSLKK